MSAPAEDRTLFAGAQYLVSPAVGLPRFCASDEFGIIVIDHEEPVMTPLDVAYMLAAPHGVRRSWLQRWFPRLYRAYLALSPKHRRLREERALLAARRWAAKRKIGAAAARFHTLFDSLNSSR